MAFRKSKAGKAKETVTDQVSDRTDDLVAALDAAREALARASVAASRKGAEVAGELGKEASKAADKLLPERARQRRPGLIGRGDPAAHQRRGQRPGPDTAELAQPALARYRPVPCLSTRPSLARAARLFTTTPRTSGVVNGSIRRWVRARSSTTVQWRVSPPASPSTRRQASLGSMTGPAYRRPILPGTTLAVPRTPPDPPGDHPGGPPDPSGQVVDLAR